MLVICWYENMLVIYLLYVKSSSHSIFTKIFLNYRMFVSLHEVFMNSILVERRVRIH